MKQGVQDNLDDISITHFGFIKEYAQIIEAKQVAQQLAERQKIIVLRDEEEKNAKIILSEEESEAARGTDRNISYINNLN
ncbi:unnamed protein product [Paramecium sonneborni]|uniref:Prohibitin n=1 Tax=Paramecium sonneborni TaxID=65129 RepID=A0A8S1RVQ0_9CILI|nr:unnamed protein product [Paramecium sonneborni]